MTKFLTSIILPPAFIALVWACGLILAARSRKRRALAFLVPAFVLYYLFSTWPLAGVLIGSLQSDYPPRPPVAERGEAEALVVLSGGISVARGAPEGVELSGSTWRRLWRGVEDFHSLGGEVPIIFSGHEDLPASPGGPGERPWLGAARRMGIPEAMFWHEDRSGNTFESAMEVKKLLDLKFPGRPRHSIILVTSAWHLPRARRSFEFQGMAVLPDPSDYRAGPDSLGLASFIPSYEALASSSVAIREWVGILAYRLLRGVLMEAATALVPSTRRPVIELLWLLVAATFPLFSVEFLRWNDQQVLRISFAVPMIVMAVILAVGLAAAMAEGPACRVPMISRPLGGLLYGLMFLFFIWHIVSLIRSEDFKWALREVTKLGIGMAAFWIVLALFPRDRRFLNRFWTICLWSSAALLSFLIYQYAFVFIRPFLGNNIDEATRAGRNMLTWYLVFMLPYAVIRFLDSKQKIIDAFPLLVLTIAWIYAGSRGAWVSVMVGLLVMMGMLIRENPSRGLKISLAVAIGVSLAMAASGWMLANYIDLEELEYGKKLVSLYDPDAVPELNSTAERMNLIEVALNDFMRHPIAGIGLMNFFGQRELVTHNDYLGILAEMGAVGFLLFLAILSLVFKLLFQRTKKMSWMALGTRASLIGVIFSISIINAYTNMIFWIFLALGIVVSETEIAGDLENAAS